MYRDGLTLCGNGCAGGEQLMSEKQIIDESMNFVFAAFETTANMFTWMMYYLSKNPEVVDNCRREIFDAVGEDG